MGDNLIIDADEVETFIISEDMVADSKPAVSLDEDYRSNGDIYDVYNIHFNRLSERKKKKKKKKHRRKKVCDNLPCFPLNEALIQFERDRFQEGAIARGGNNIPPTLILNPRYAPGFLFGKTLSDNYVGKPQDKDGHIAVVDNMK